MELSRSAAMELLRKHNRDEGHIRHALAVEATMRWFARKAGADEELWGMAGLLHDIDWEKMQATPHLHTKEGAAWLRAEGYPEEIARAVEAHGWGLCSDVEPKSDMEKTLFTIDELTGMVITAALVRPSRSLADLEVKSVKKKWKDKAFARGVDRELILKGAGMMGMELDDLILGVIEAMRPVEKDLGLGLPG
jgi:putative nucleotidyltransferase with HDIG domain